MVSHNVSLRLGCGAGVASHRLIQPNTLAVGRSWKGWRGSWHFQNPGRRLLHHRTVQSSIILLRADSHYLAVTFLLRFSAMDGKIEAPRPLVPNTLLWDMVGTSTSLRACDCAGGKFLPNSVRRWVALDGDAGERLPRAPTSHNRGLGVWVGRCRIFDFNGWALGSACLERTKFCALGP